MSKSGPYRRTLKVGAGVIVEDGEDSLYNDPRVFIHLNTDDDKVDEDAYMTADEAEKVVWELSAALSVARNPQQSQGKDERGLPANQVTGPIPTAEEVGSRLKPDGGDHTALAHFTAGEAETIVERYDYKMPDGTIDSDYEVRANWPDHGCGIADFQLQRDSWHHLDDMIAVLTAARLYTRELVAA
ncbi:hypothetical protein [Gordonia westfalica]|uniref:hypothetical protein n=1 Tax=Gordonia westfalica TaxID=158898 RepID=UPI00287BC81C|nr:hypothetical protein [Gordonia westfalica]